MAELKQSRSVGKSAGAKDAKALRGNANRTVEAPKLPDMTERSLVSLDGPTEEILLRCEELRREGKTFPEISKALGLPLSVLYRWREEQPEFLERTGKGFDDWIDTKAEEVIGIADQIPKVRGLRPGEKMIGLKHQASIRLQAASVRLAAWGRQNATENGIMILDIGRDGPTKTLNLPGSNDGQNIAALAAGRWQTPRKEIPVDRSAGDGDSQDSEDTGKQSHRRARALPGPGSSEQDPGKAGA